MDSVAQHLERLARLALDVLDAQQAYFKTRSQTDLIRSKQLEKQLREVARAALASLDQQPG
jgi:hypothetical protein